MSQTESNPVVGQEVEKKTTNQVVEEIEEAVKKDAEATKTADKPVDDSEPQVEEADEENAEDEENQEEDEDDEEIIQEKTQKNGSQEQPLNGTPQKKDENSNGVHQNGNAENGLKTRKRNTSGDQHADDEAASKKKRAGEIAGTEVEAPQVTES